MGIYYLWSVKTPRKKEITLNTAKSEALNTVLANCKDIQSLVMVGRFETLVIIEGYYLIGLRLGLWSSVAAMFRLLRGLGLSYAYTSYFRFKSGEYYYLPNIFLSALAACCSAPFSVAYIEGLPSALSTAQLHPERWVIPSYALAASGVGSVPSV